MRTRINTYSFTAGTRKINTGIADLTIDDIKVIINETQKKNICSSFLKDNITEIVNGVVTYKDSYVDVLGKTVVLPTLASGDILTIEIDKGESYPDVAGLATELQSGKNAIAQAIVSKGGIAQPTESLAELAQSINAIPNYLAFAKLAAVLMEPYATNATEGIKKTNKLETTDITDPFGLCERIVSYFLRYTLITSVSLPNATSVGTYAFDSCSALQSVSLPNATSVGNYAFRTCTALQSVSLPNATSVGTYAFSSCTALQSVSLPNATSVGSYVCSSCTALQSVEFGKLLSFIGTNTFIGCPYLAKIKVGAGTDINLNFSAWSPTSIPASENEQFNIDFVDGIINNLYDYSGGTAHTLTLSANVKSRLTAETIALANVKGWNIA